jgi:peptidylprolyl isomerase
MSMKLRSLAAVSAVLALGSGLSMAQATKPNPAAPAARPAAAAAPAASRTTLSYALGYQFARSLAQRGVDLDMNALNRAIQEGYAKKPPSMPPEQLQAAVESFTKKMAEQERAEYDRVNRENKAKSDAFLAANKAKPGVVTLPSGVQYRVIEAGAGPKPTNASTLQLTLRASLPSGDSLSDANAPPETLKLSELGPEMAGVKEALLMMPAGARWEIFVPASKAYGENPRSPVGPSQALVFDIRVISIK